MEREAVVWNCSFFERNASAQNGSKAACKWEVYPNLRETVPYRTASKSRVNAVLCKLPLIKTMNFGLDSISLGAVSCGAPLMIA